MDSPKAIVRTGYDRIAERYETWGGDSGTRQKYLQAIASEVTGGERVLDLGCGTGHHATRFLAERYEVVAVDLSPVSASLARAAVPGASVVIADMASVAFPPGTFAAVTAFFSLIHVPRDEHERVLRSIRSWLEPGGILAVTMGAGEAGDEIDDFLGVSMYWSGWSREENLRLIRAAGFRIRSAIDETEDEDGTPVTHLWILPEATSGYQRRRSG